MVADVVDYVKLLSRIAVVEPQSSTELLQPDDPRFGGSQHHDGIESRHINAFVEDINGTQNREGSVLQRFQRFCSWSTRRAGMHCFRGNAMLDKVPSHEIRMDLRHAECDRAA